VAAVLLPALVPASLRAQLTSSELYSTFQNKVDVADTLTEKLMAGRRSGGAPLESQPLEGAVDPNVYVLGPGDGVFLNVYAVHGLDQDLTVTPEGRLLIPSLGRVDVSGLTIAEAEKRVKAALGKFYKSPDVGLSLRRLRPIKVSILGEVLSPGIQTATALQRVSEVIDKSGGFKTTSSLRNIQVRTATGTLRTKADLFRYYALGDLSANPIVEAGDVIVVNRATQFILVSGSVASAQRIEFVDGDSLSTAIALCRGLLPSAIKDSIELARFPLSGGLIPAEKDNFADWRNVDYAHGDNPLLREGDQIFVRSYGQYHVPRLVAIGGEVPFPGRFPIEPGVTRLKDIISRAGGILQTASLEEAVVIRKVGVGSWEEDPEFKRITNLAPMRKEGMTDEEYSYYAARLDQFFRSTMVVDFQALMSGDETQNILLRENDSISIPRAFGYVTVSGSVNKQGNVGYIEGGTWQDYIAKAGGFSSTADRSAMRVVNPKTGSYIDPRSNSGYKIAPGDMLIVPQEKHEFWKDFSQVATLTAQIVTIVATLYILWKHP